MKSPLGLIILSLILKAAYCPVNAQTERLASSTLFIELAGATYYYSINYDQLIFENVSVRLGYSYIPSLTDATNQGATVFPVMVNYLLGKGSSHLEVGAGFVFENSTRAKRYLTSAIGYRYQPRDGGPNFRIAIYPTTFEEPQFLAGVSFGYTL